MLSNKNRYWGGRMSPESSGYCPCFCLFFETLASLILHACAKTNFRLTFTVIYMQSGLKHAYKNTSVKSNGIAIFRGDFLVGALCGNVFSPKGWPKNLPKL